MKKKGKTVLHKKVKKISSFDNIHHYINKDGRQVGILTHKQLLEAKPKVAALMKESKGVKDIVRTLKSYVDNPEIQILNVVTGSNHSYPELVECILKTALPPEDGRVFDGRYGIDMKSLLEKSAGRTPDNFEELKTLTMGRRKKLDDKGFKEYMEKQLKTNPVFVEGEKIPWEKPTSQCLADLERRGVVERMLEKDSSIDKDSSPQTSKKAYDNCRNSLIEKINTERGAAIENINRLIADYLRVNLDEQIIDIRPHLYYMWIENSDEESTSLAKDLDSMGLGKYSGETEGRRRGGLLGGGPSQDANVGEKTKYDIFDDNFGYQRMLGSNNPVTGQGNKIVEYMNVARAIQYLKRMIALWHLETKKHPETMMENRFQISQLEAQIDELCSRQYDNVSDAEKLSIAKRSNSFFMLDFPAEKNAPPPLDDSGFFATSRSEDAFLKRLITYFDSSHENYLFDESRWDEEMYSKMNRYNSALKGLKPNLSFEEAKKEYERLSAQAKKRVLTDEEREKSVSLENIYRQGLELKFSSFALTAMDVFQEIDDYFAENPKKLNSCDPRFIRCLDNIKNKFHWDAWSKIKEGVSSENARDALASFVSRLTKIPGMTKDDVQGKGENPKLKDISIVLSQEVPGKPNVFTNSLLYHCARGKKTTMSQSITSIKKSFQSFVKSEDVLVVSNLDECSSLQMGQEESEKLMEAVGKEAGAGLFNSVSTFCMTQNDVFDNIITDRIKNSYGNKKIIFVTQKPIYYKKWGGRRITRVRLDYGIDELEGKLLTQMAIDLAIQKNTDDEMSAVEVESEIGLTNKDLTSIATILSGKSVVEANEILQVAMSKVIKKNEELKSSNKDGKSHLLNSEIVNMVREVNNAKILEGNNGLTPMKATLGFDYYIHLKDSEWGQQVEMFSSAIETMENDWKMIDELTKEFDLLEDRILTEGGKLPNAEVSKIKKRQDELAKDIKSFEIELAKKFSDLGTRHLLHGTPGVGKSIFTECLANKFGFELTLMSLAADQSGLAGSSEAFTERMLDSLRYLKNTVVLWDEIDRNIGTGDDKRHHWEERRMSEILRVFSDESFLKRLEENHVVIVGTCNHLENVDDALKNRFKVHFVPPPDTAECFAKYLENAKPILSSGNLVLNVPGSQNDAAETFEKFNEMMSQIDLLKLGEKFVDSKISFRAMEQWLKSAIGCAALWNATNVYKTLYEKCKPVQIAVDKIIGTDPSAIMGFKKKYAKGSFWDEEEIKGTKVFVLLKSPKLAGFPWTQQNLEAAASMTEGESFESPSIKVDGNKILSSKYQQKMEGADVPSLGDLEEYYNIDPLQEEIEQEKRTQYLPGFEPYEDQTEEVETFEPEEEIFSDINKMTSTDYYLNCLAKKGLLQKGDFAF